MVVCSICDVRMSQTDDPSVLQCSQCKRTYIIGREPLQEEDEMVSVHEDENVELGGISGGPGLLAENDDPDLFSPRTNRTQLKLKDGEHLIDYEEYMPDPT